VIQPRILLILLLLTAVTLTACKRGPDTRVLEQELHDRLDTEFSPGLFRIHSLTRKGSAPSTSGDDAVYMYFDAELEFQRDYNLTAWQGLNLGTLAIVLGATPAGIEGYHQNNQQGDLLRVRGRLSYRKTEDGWENITYAPLKKAAKPAITETTKGSGPGSVLQSVRRLLQRTSGGQGQSRDDIIIEEFGQSLKEIDLRSARLDGMLPFGTGWSGGTYNRFGTTFAPYATKHGLQVFNYSSEGSVENGLSLQEGHLDFALLQSDVAEVLYKGWVEASQLPQPDLRSMASLWPEAMHIITLEDRNIPAPDPAPGLQPDVYGLHPDISNCRLARYVTWGYRQLLPHWRPVRWMPFSSPAPFRIRRCSYWRSAATMYALYRLTPRHSISCPLNTSPITAR
jgi:hypothetical protein